MMAPISDAPVRLESGPPAVAEARAIVHRAGAGLPQGMLGDAELLVSELVSNAVRHGGAEVHLRVERADHTLMVQVHDDGDGVPAARPEKIAIDVPSGRGLQMVDLVAESWGVHEGDETGYSTALDSGTSKDAGKTVWFRLTTAEVGPEQRTGGVSGWSS